MAAPILITAAALTAAWALLGQKRQEMCADCGGEAVEAPEAEAGFRTPEIEKRSTGGPTAGDETAVGVEGLAEAADTSGSTIIGDPGTAGTTAPIVQTAPEATVPHAFNTDPSVSTGGSDPSTQKTMPTTTKLDAATISMLTSSPAMIYYGSTDGLTRSQQSAAMDEVGTLSGMIW
jgi:hypothetical protein